MFSIDLHEYLVDPERRYQYARHDSPLECEPQVIDMRRFPFALSIPRHGSKFPHPPFRDYRSFAKVYRFRCLAESSATRGRFRPHIAPARQSGCLNARFPYSRPPFASHVQLPASVYVPTPTFLRRNYHRRTYFIAKTSISL